MEVTGSPVKFALSNPWRALEMAVDGPLHPGGKDATEDLLDRAGVTEGTRVLDSGCGAGISVEAARERGASAVGLDTDPKPQKGIVRGDLGSLPLGDSTVDVVLSECSICLCSDVSVALSESRRVLKEGGRLAVSDVTVEGEVPSGLPDPLVDALCLGENRGRSSVLSEIEERFEVNSVKDHREDILQMRDEIKGKVNYETLLTLMGEEGKELLDGINELETAIEDRKVGYVSVVATC
jgi:arsenite methyltransferase